MHILYPEGSFLSILSLQFKFSERFSHRLQRTSHFFYEQGSVGWLQWQITPLHIWGNGLRAFVYAGPHYLYWKCLCNRKTRNCEQTLFVSLFVALMAVLSSPVVYKLIICCDIYINMYVYVNSCGCFCVGTRSTQTQLSTQGLECVQRGLSGLNTNHRAQRLMDWCLYETLL